MDARDHGDTARGEQLLFSFLTAESKAKDDALRISEQVEF